MTGVDLVSFSGADDAVARFLRNYMLSGIPLTACLFLAGALDSFFNERIAHGPLTVVMAIIASASTFVVAASHDVGSLACDIAMVGTGLGTAFVCLRVGLVTSRLSGTEACVTISSAALLSFLIYFAVKGAPGDISVVLVSLLPFASVFCSFCVPDEVSETDPLEEAISIDKLPQGFFVRLVLAVCAFALAAGVSKGIGMIVVSGASTPVECIVSLVCIAGFILGLCLLLRTRNFNVSSLYLPIGLLMAFAMLGTPILGSPDIVQSAITGVLYNIFVIVVWCLLIDLAGRTTLTPARVFGFGRGAPALGTTVGVVVVMLNQGLFSGDSVYYVAYLAVMSVLLVLVFTLALSTGTIERAFDVMLAKQERQAVERLSQRAAEGQTPNEFTAKTEEAHAFEEAPGALFDRACMTLASEAKLTARETEVLALLARGRTIGYVADELVIAQNTAKGYVKNVYAKLGIHSRQELIDAVEELYLRM